MAQPASPDQPDRSGAAFLIAAVLGGVLWMAITGDTDAPHQSPVNAPNPDGPLAAFFGIALVIAPLVLGALFPGCGGAIGAGLAGVPLLLAPWTASRGDGDGLWVLVFPYLIVAGVCAAAMADLAGWVRRRLSRRVTKR